ncbi:MAG TPA: RNA methyltransferase [Actinomycetota bacterium]|nr:RNA methyltransferase [Actinomycetota bacterium]
MAERIEDPSDPRLRDFLHLRDTDLRTSLEAAEGIFIAEGATTIQRALVAGYRPRAFVGTPDRVAAFDGADAPSFEVDEEVLATTAGFRVHRGALASFDRRPLPAVADLLAGARRVVVLDDLVDTTNLGLILRSVAALGWDAALLTPRCADPLYRRAVKTSMGVVFTLPWTRIPHRDGPAMVRDAGFTLAALTPDGDIEVREAVVPERLALVLGSEGPGVSARWRDTADLRIRIAMRDGVDSLNVAAAAAIALHTLG